LNRTANYLLRFASNSFQKIKKFQLQISAVLTYHG
jgi:hypothetical protein